MHDGRRRLFLDECWEKIRDELNEGEKAFFNRTDFTVRFNDDEREFIDRMIAKYQDKVEY